ncbi:hypothetical protein [Faecalispora jeddahensis]|uniref:hypothetical protein n=1 Tax=Faecalispora jeddahensis TaxID=1414721 RepID=UPI00189705E3|nr:hypothetical protein [Faecalispora jeddahensis]
MAQHEFVLINTVYPEIFDTDEFYRDLLNKKGKKDIYIIKEVVSMDMDIMFYLYDFFKWIPIRDCSVRTNKSIDPNGTCVFDVKSHPVFEAIVSGLSTIFSVAPEQITLYRDIEMKYSKAYLSNLFSELKTVVSALQKEHHYLVHLGV